MILWLAGVAWFASVSAGRAAPADPSRNGDNAVAVAAAEETPPASAGRVQFQELEDPVEPFEPKRKRTKADEARLDSMAAFARGRILEEREDYRGAIAAYEQAVEFDPTAIPVYRALIGLAGNLRRGDLVIKWLTRAAESNPEELQFVLKAVQILVETNNAKGAVKILERAAAVPGIDRHSPRFLDITRTLSLLYLELERPDDAVAGLEVLLDALKNPEAYHLDAKQLANLAKDLDFEKFGQVFLKAKKTDLALSAFRTAAELKKGKPQTNLSYNLAQVYLQAGQPAEALDELQKYISAQRQSKGRAAYELLAEILAKLDKSSDLVPRLESAAENDSRNTDLQYFLADQYAAAGRLDDAETLYKKTLESAVDVQGYLGLAAVYRRQGRVESLLEALAKAWTEAGELTHFAAELKAISADPKLVESLLKLAAGVLAEQPPKVEFASAYILANVAGEAKQTEIAEKLYRLLLAARKEKAELIYRELGMHFVKNRQFADAGRIYLEAADDDDLSDSRPQNLLMATQPLALAGKTKEALEAINAAQAIIPNNPMLRYQEAWVYSYSHQYDEAIEKLEKVIADFPQPIPQVREIVRQAQHTLSNVHVQRGDNRKGEEILEEIYKEDPDDEQVNNDLGYLYADQGKNLEQAESMIRKAVTAKPENGAYLDSMGWVLFKREKFEEALPWLEKAVKNLQGSGDETLWDHLADVYDRLNQHDKALDAWKKSLEMAEKALHPDQKLIERVKEKIEKQKK
ncbi:MAG: tetratricopeptide repeat protein [Planctomycetia bacterium]|nr:tetratricopeptide repeat protein [Planctomycetia bacterium]